MGYNLPVVKSFAAGGLEGMNKDFSRIITLLRKEKGLSQKQVATDLNISQALLSHYEKGVRECGLDFVIKLSDYYNVSCDYLLGKTPNKSGKTLNLEDIPDSSENKDNKFSGSVLPTLNKKLIVNSISIIFDLLGKSKNKSLTGEVSGYLMICVYNVFRNLYSANAKNPQGLFKIPNTSYEALCSASLSLLELSIKRTIKSSGKSKEDAASLVKLPLSPDIISKEYPLYAASLYNLLQTGENAISAKIK